MANRSKAFEHKQRDNRGGWQLANPKPAVGFVRRPNTKRRLSDFDPTRSVLVDMSRFREILQQEPELTIAGIIRNHVMPTIRDSALSYRSHELAVTKEATSRLNDYSGTTGTAEQTGLVFVFKRSRHAMLFKLMWG